MQRKLKVLLGATMLEILLVLAVAALIIVMSIKYYQSSKESQDVNAVMQAISAITSAVDNLGSGLGGSSSYLNVTPSTLTSSLGSAAMKSPVTLAPIVFTKSTDGVTYQVVIPMTPQTCSLAKARLTVMKKFINVTCNGGNLSYTYDNSGS